MSDSILKARAELKALGYETFEFDWQNGRVVAFQYTIEAGSKAGTPVLVGISFQEEGYPEYPPHWVHVSPPIPDHHGGGQAYCTDDGREWLAMSRAPGSTWDRLPMPKRDMASYIEEHMRRMWRHV